MRQASTTGPILLLLISPFAFLLGCQSTDNLGGSAFTQHLTASTDEPRQFGLEAALDIQLALARTLEQQEDYDAAADAYRAIIERQPKSAGAIHRLAILHDRKREFEKSAELFEEVLKLDEKNPEALCDYAYSLYLQRRWEESEIHVKRALNLRTAHRRAHNQLGLLLAQREEYDQAFQEFRAAGGTMADAHINVAVVMMMNDQLFEAWNEYQIALRADPESKEIWSRIKTYDRPLLQGPLENGSLRLVDRRSDSLMNTASERLRERL